jgi:hypothetical protein
MSHASFTLSYSLRTWRWLEAIRIRPPPGSSHELLIRCRPCPFLGYNKDGLAPQSSNRGRSSLVHAWDGVEGRCSRRQAAQAVHDEWVIIVDQVAVHSGWAFPLGAAFELRDVQVSVSCELNGGL